MSKFCTGIEIYNRFSLKISVCGHKLEGLNPLNLPQAIPLRLIPRIARNKRVYNM